MKWTKGVLDIPLCDGTSQRVTAVLLGVWAVHKSIEKPTTWTVTHIFTGKALKRTIKLKRESMALVETLIDLDLEFKTCDEDYLNSRRDLLVDLVNDSSKWERFGRLCNMFSVGEEVRSQHRRHGLDRLRNRGQLRHDDETNCPQS